MTRCVHGASALALLLFLAGEAARAQQTKEQGAQAGAAANDIAIDMATKSVREGRADDALALIKEAATRHPEWPPARLILARIYSSIGQPAQSRKILEQAIVDAPGNPDIILAFANVDLTDGRLHDAELNCEKILELAAKGEADAEKAASLRREANAGLAAVAENRQQWETARTYLLAWLKDSPKSGPARQRLGRALFQLGQRDEAFKELTQAYKDDPSLDLPGVTMAVLSAQKGDTKKAAEWYEQAQKIEPKNVKVKLAYARWLVDQGKPEDAAGVVDQAAKLAPESKEPDKLKALIAWHLRDLPTAEKLLDPLNRESPADAGIANLLALALVEQDDSAKRARGLQIAEVNARQYPQAPDIQATLGRAYYRAGMLDEAERALNTAVTSNNGQVTGDTAFFLSRLIADRGRVDDARRFLGSIVNLPGAFAYRKDAKELLAKLDGDAPAPSQDKEKDAARPKEKAKETAPKSKAAAKEKGKP